MALRAAAGQFRFLRAPRRFLSSGEDDHTHFGFQNVRTAEKQERVNEVFTNVASRYDLMNDAMSGGIHRLWKDHFVRRIAPDYSLRCLDVAGGTGDIAFRLVNFANQQADLSLSDRLVHEPQHLTAETEAAVEVEESYSVGGGAPRISVSVCDINAEMMRVGEARAKKLGLDGYLSWTEGNAEHLPFEDNSFDLYTIAYGIRNCTNLDLVLREAHRVLRPMGRFACLEFSQVGNPLLRRAYDEYSFQVIPVLGQVLAGDWESYQYLVESIRQFPNQAAFSQMIREAGFGCVAHEDLFFGVSAIHSAFKLPSSHAQSSERSSNK